MAVNAPGRKKNTLKFLNFSGLKDDDAQELVGQLKSKVAQAESDRQPDVRRAEEAVRVYKNDLWSQEDIDFFEEFDMTPYQVPYARAPFNKIIDIQKRADYDFQFVPVDSSSYERHRKNRGVWVEEHIDEFDTPKQAREYYDLYADDELALAVSKYYEIIREKEGIGEVENKAFENMVITGLDFFKTTYQDGINTERRSVRQMFYDRSSVDPLLKDVEYIGEVNRLYKDDLITFFPQHKQEILDRFESYTTFRHESEHNLNQTDWKEFYDFDTERDAARMKLAEMWFRTAEDRIQIVDSEENDIRLARYGLEEEDVWNKLKEIMIDRFFERAKQGDQQMKELFQRPKDEIDGFVEEQVRGRFELRPTQKMIWNKAVFSHYGLFEFKRDPLPHGSHPYTPAFAQFVEGWYTGLVDDVKDLLIALNKAAMFRELMMAHGAKGLLVVDRKTVNHSQYSIDDIREMWTQIGGIIDLDLKGNRKLSDVFQQVTTIGEGFAEITRVIEELEQRVRQIIGVNDAMMGFVGNEAASSQVRQRIQEGQGNNGIIFENFNHALESHVKDKVYPLVITEMLQKKPKALRVLGENRSQWLEMTYDKEFELFADAIENGEYTVKLERRFSDDQMTQQQQAILLQTAMQDPNLSTEAALEFSGIDQIRKFLRRSREITRHKQRQSVANQVDLQQLQQLMLQRGMDQDTVNELISEAKLQRLKELEAEQNEGNQTTQGAGMVQREAGQPQRMRAIEDATLNTEGD